MPQPCGTPLRNVWPAPCHVGRLRFIEHGWRPKFAKLDQLTSDSQPDGLKLVPSRRLWWLVTIFAQRCLSARSDALGPRTGVSGDPSESMTVNQLDKVTIR